MALFLLRISTVGIAIIRKWDGVQDEPLPMLYIPRRNLQKPRRLHGCGEVVQPSGVVAGALAPLLIGRIQFGTLHPPVRVFGAAFGNEIGKPVFPRLVFLGSLCHYVGERDFKMVRTKFYCSVHHPRHNGFPSLSGKSFGVVENALVRRHLGQKGDDGQPPPGAAVC